MNRRVLSAVAVLAAASVVAVVPAQAATKKPKPKPIKKSYTLTLLPDPSGEGGVADPVDGHCSVSPAAQDVTEVKIPAKGTLRVILEMQNPAGTGQTTGLDWDLHILDADGGPLSSSTGGDGREETFDKLKKKQTVYIEACNWTGLPQATVTYVFTYA